MRTHWAEYLLEWGTTDAEKLCDAAEYSEKY